jgi:hypothetical protein
MDVREPSPTHFRGRVTPLHALDLYVASPHSLIHPTLASTLSSTCRTGPSIAITDEASPLALLSTRNRLRRAVRRGAPWTVERHEQLPGRCRGSGDLAVSHRRAVSGCELASAASTGTIRRPSGSPSCGVVEEVRLLATPFVALSGVHVSHVRVRPVGAVVVRGASWSGDSPLLSAGERPAADGRARLGGDHETGWAPCRLAQESAVGRLVWAAAHAWKGRDAPWFPQAG